MQKGFIISRPGNAGPSPARQLSAEARPAAPRETYPIANGDASAARRDGGIMAGLIRRRAPIRHDSVQVGAEYAPLVAAAPLKRRAVDLARVASASAILPDFESGPPPIPSAPPHRASGPVAPFGQTRRRRQLTVRLGMALFAKFDRVAKATGRTYQDIQAKAIERYLENPATGAAAAPKFERPPGRKPLFGRVRRRQLTVRLEMALFARLDRMAKTTGRTYQDIQAKAIARYLEERAVSAGCGEDEEFGISIGAKARNRLQPSSIRVNRGLCIQSDSRILAPEFQSMSSA